MSDISVPARILSNVGELLLNPGIGKPGIHITGLPGLDSPEVRAPIQNAPQRDYALDHEFFIGARPFSIEGVILTRSNMDRTNLEDTLKAHWFALLKAGIYGLGRYCWTPYGQVERFISIKPSDKLAIDGTKVKTFQMPVTCYDPTIYTHPQNTTLISSSGTITNSGTAPSWPVIRLSSGTMTITNNSFAPPRSIVLTGADGHFSAFIEIITIANTIYADGHFADLNKYVIFSLNRYWPLLPGDNDIVVTGGTATFLWNHGWI